MWAPRSVRQGARRFARGWARSRPRSAAGVRAALGTPSAHRRRPSRRVPLISGAPRGSGRRPPPVRARLRPVAWPRRRACPRGLCARARPSRVRPIPRTRDGRTEHITRPPCHVPHAGRTRPPRPTRPAYRGLFILADQGADKVSPRIDSTKSIISVWRSPLAGSGKRTLCR